MDFPIFSSRPPHSSCMSGKTVRWFAILKREGGSMAVSRFYFRGNFAFRESLSGGTEGEFERLAGNAFDVATDQNERLSSNAAMGGIAE